MSVIERRCRTVRATSAADAASQMAYADQVIMVPGYALAVAQAQHTVKEVASSLLEAKDVEVKYHTAMLFGDAKTSVGAVIEELKAP